MNGAMEDFFNELYGSAEPLTDKLIEELVKRDAWDLEELQKFRKEGFLYNRKRCSIVSPLQGDLSLLDRIDFPIR